MRPPPDWPCWLRQRVLPLTSREYDLLQFLMHHQGVNFTRQELLEQIWGWSHGDLSTVTVHVRRLRQKIEEDAAQATGGPTWELHAPAAGLALLALLALVALLVVVHVSHLRLPGAAATLQPTWPGPVGGRTRSADGQLLPHGRREHLLHDAPLGTAASGWPGPSGCGAAQSRPARW
jgi:hypothetical protein